MGTAWAAFPPLSPLVQHFLVLKHELRVIRAVVILLMECNTAQYFPGGEANLTLSTSKPGQKEDFPCIVKNTMVPHCETKSARILLDINVLVTLFASAFGWAARQVLESGISACVKAWGEVYRKATGTMQKGKYSGEFCREQNYLLLVSVQEV